ncbi:MAG: hypothetical protein EOP39_15175 [Rubrivivax sp.]|nr:MAG: hypothetical protein EOP39_15175 [Rubrivivax sp.]
MASRLQHPIGPFIRVLAVLFLVALTCLLLAPGVSVGQETLATTVCASGRGWLFCEARNLLVQLLPASRHGLLITAGRVAFAGLNIWLIWWMLRPLLGKAA